ncbi:MAG: PHB depolymerase family esterase [Haliangiales bacterium]
MAGLTLTAAGLAGCDAMAEEPAPEEVSETRAVTTAAALESVSSFGSNPGNLTMYRYVPGNLPAGAGLVVAMHGCTQSAGEYLIGPGWDTLADEQGFAVVLPEQKSGNNFNKCFNWFESGDIARGQGEAKSIISMVDHMVANFDIDPDRIFVTGLSAGGAMTAVMLAAYPDVFAGGAIMAGVPYKCANSVSSGFSCMSSASGTPQQWGDRVRSATNYNGPWPTVSIWHGTSDYTVNQVNQNELLEQWTNVHGIDRTADSQSTVGSATRQTYKDSSGAVQVETWTLNGMGHATAVDPGTGPEQCGATGAYFSDEGVCSSFQVATLWGLTDGGGTDPTDPPDDPTDPPDDPTDPPDDPTDPPDNGHQCTETNDNNYNHVQAGRAYHSLGYVFAVGTDDAMGLYNVFTRHTLAEIEPGVYQVGSCP